MSIAVERPRCRRDAAPRAATIRRARRRRLRRAAWNVVGLAVFVVLVFPVFWMISTALKPDREINAFSPTWLPTHPTLQHFRDAMDRPYFWDDVKNSLIVVGAVVVLAMVVAIPRRGGAREVPLHGQKPCSSSSSSGSSCSRRPAS